MSSKSGRIDANERAAPFITKSWTVKKCADFTLYIFYFLHLALAPDARPEKLNS